MSLMDQEVRPPRDGKIQKITVSTTAGSAALAAHMVGPGWVRVKAMTANVEVLFGDSGVPTLTYGAVGSSGVGYPIAAGTFEDFYLTDDTHISYDADTNGSLTLLRCGRPPMGEE